MVELSDTSIRVLYVNSDPDFTELVRTKLQRADFDIDYFTAETVDAALEKLSTERIDCVVTAYSLADGTGIDLTESVRQQDADVPILLFTGQGTEEIASESTRAGVTDYIPIRADRDNFELLARRIQALAETARQRRQADRLENRFRRTLERTTDAIYAVDTEWRFEFMNDKMAERVGCDPDAVVGKNLWEEFPSITGTELEERYRNAVDTGEPVSFEQYLGEPFDYWVEVRAFPDEDGLTVFSRDITDERERQRKLERYETVCHNVQDAVFVLDEERVVEFANPVASRVLGGTRSANIEGTKLSDLVGQRTAETDARAFTGAVDETLREMNGESTATGGYDADLQIEVETSAGQRVFDVGLTPFQASERPQVLVVARDVTSEERQKRKRVDRQLRALIEHTSEYIYIKDLDGRYRLVNDAAADLFGVEAESVVGKRDAELFDEESVSGTGDVDQRMIERGEADTREAVRYIDGEKYVFLESPYRDADGEIHGVVGISRDDTERETRDTKNRRLAEEYDTLLKNSGDAIFLLDVDSTGQETEFRFARLSPGYETQTGLKTEEVREKTPREVFGDERGAELESNYQRCVDKGEPISYREELPVAEDARFWQTSLAPVVVDGEIIRIVGIARNVTEQVRRERELERANQRLESLIEAAPLTIMEIDTDGNVVRWNDGAEEMFGWTRSEVIGEFNPIVPDDQRSEFRANRQRALNGERIRGKEVRRETKDGERLDLLLSVAPLTDAEGEVTSVLAVLEDITQQKQLETRLRSLQETAQKLSRAQSNEEIGTIAVDAAVEILGFEITGIWEYSDRKDALVPIAESPAARELFGESPRFDSGDSLAWEAFESGELRLYDDVQTEERRHNPETDIRSEIQIPLGDHGLMSAGSPSPQVFSDADVDLFNILGATVEAALVRADRETELQRQNERLDQFASVVAHDLRNPLTVAMGFLEIAEETGDPEHFEKVASAHGRIERLIEDLLTLARGETTIDDTEQIDLGAVATEAWGYVDTNEATLSAAAEIPAVAGDGGRLAQLFENLFRNAVEHGGDDVTITAGSLDDSEGFFVEDDGRGIPPDKREEVFEHGVTSNAGGTGFGLSIVADIAKAHGWTVSVTEGTDGGARFEFEISQ